MPDPELVKAVGGGDVGRELDLQSLFEAIEADEVRYDPEYWPGLYIRFSSESPAVMVFRTGKYNIAGADSINSLFETNKAFLSILNEFSIGIDESSFEIRNLVFLERYDRELELDALAIGLGLEHAEYEPEQFPGLLFRPPDATGTFLIFRNGKIVLTGTKGLDAAVNAYCRLFHQLNELFERS